MNVIVTYNTSLASGADDPTVIITIEELRSWVVGGTFFRHMFRYADARLYAYNIDHVPKPFALGLLVWLLGRRTRSFEDIKGRSVPITLRALIGLLLRLLSDWLSRSKLLRTVLDEVESLYPDASDHRRHAAVDLAATPFYLRTDLWFGIRSGGSVGHIAGVLNNLDHFTGAPVFLSSDEIPTVREDIPVRYILPDRRFWDFPELPGLHYNVLFYDGAAELMRERRPAFIYQRYSLNNFSGIKLAKYFGIPFVLEYNGSEVWINRNWGTPLKYEKLSERIELLNLAHADLIVVVSSPMKDELTARGIVADKILVNPNGVDPDRYSPRADGSSIRSRYGLKDKVVIGFIGTFGRWHGAEVLADAFGQLLNEYPEYRETVSLLMIGDGLTMPLVKELLAKHSVGDACILTGRVHQEEGPVHLAACDILVSPHVPNSDGTPFFGSPTKLFEYMAMGKGIVASDLDQIGEVLEHDRTAWMVKPGDMGSLMEALRSLIDDRPLRERLGEAARKEVESKYTWKEHTRKIVDRFKEVTGSV